MEYHCIPPWTTGTAIDQNGLSSKYIGMRLSLLIPNFLVRTVLNGILLGRLFFTEALTEAESNGQSEEAAGTEDTSVFIDSSHSSADIASLGPRFTCAS